MLCIDVRYSNEKKNMVYTISSSLTDVVPKIICFDLCNQSKQ
jgi:hypothetical protein